MARAFILCIFVFTFLSSPVSCDDDLKRQFEDLKQIVYNEIGPLKRYIREQLLADVFKALQSSIQNEISSAISITLNTTVNKSMEMVLKNIETSSLKVEALGIELNTFKNVYSSDFERSQQNSVRKFRAINNKIDDLQSNYRKVETLNSSFEVTVRKVEGLANIMKNLQSYSSSLRTLNSSLDNTAIKSDVTCAAAHHLNKTKTDMHGLLVATYHGIYTFHPPTRRIETVWLGTSYGLAFNWNSEKVYWLEDYGRIMKANLNGTDKQNILYVNAMGLALDPITGNIYFKNRTSNDIRVCSEAGRNCSVVAVLEELTESQSMHDKFVVYSSRRFIFWANKTSVVKANKDGTDAKVIMSGSADGFFVDEDSDRLYWTNDGEMASADLDGHDRKVILRDRYSLDSIVVDNDLIYFADGGLNSVWKTGRSPHTIMNTNQLVRYIDLFGTKIHHCRFNPCESHPCSFLCVPKQETFACLCSPGQQLGQDGTTCL